MKILIFQYWKMLISVLISIAIIIFSFWCTADLGGFGIFIALVGGGGICIIPIMYAYDKGKERTCSKCGKFNSLKSISCEYNGETIRKYTESESVKVGEIHELGSFLPTANIYETRDIEHAKSTKYWDHKAVCRCCGNEQKFLESSFFEFKKY